MHTLRKLSHSIFDPEQKKTAGAEAGGKVTIRPTRAANRKHPTIEDEQLFLFSRTKGLAHGHNGLLIDPTDFVDFGKTSERTGGGRVPGCWEPDASAMPPVARLRSLEFAAEMGELYWMALSRDWPVAGFMAAELVDGLKTTSNLYPPLAIKGDLDKMKKKVETLAMELRFFLWFHCSETTAFDTRHKDIPYHRRFLEEVSVGNLFRGVGEDGWDTPFLSQLLVMGTGPFSEDPGARFKARAAGRIHDGARTIEQKVRIARPGMDYMVRWADWLDVQNGRYKSAPVPDVFVGNETRFMSRLRDLTTLYIRDHRAGHDERFCQAYVNAARILLSERYAFDAGLACRGNLHDGDDGDTVTPFGAGHMLALLAEVAERARDTARTQDIPMDRRLPPEAAAALFHTVYTDYHPQRDLDPPLNGKPYAKGDGSLEAVARDLIADRIAVYTHPYRDGKPEGSEINLAVVIEEILVHNSKRSGDETGLLPMAFPDGAPMDPAQGAAHAVVAGACVTLLKAFFNMRNPNDRRKPAFLVDPGERALVPSPGKDEFDTGPDMFCVEIPFGLTLEGELNKLMWNAAGALNLAGVHYYCDTIECTLFGEAISIGMLREQMLVHKPADNASMTVPLLVPRMLPAWLLDNADGAPGGIGKDDYVHAVKINADATREAVPETPGRSTDYPVVEDINGNFMPECRTVH